jgi:hypothetical protein
MAHQQHVRTLCLDCAVAIFVPDDSIVTCTRCERCLRKYGQQLYLLQQFLMLS